MSEPIAAAFAEDAPLYRAVRAYARANPLRLHTPGHAGRADALGGIFGPALALDVTELPGTDSLYEAAGPIREAEERAAAVFGSACTLFSAGGATLCIQAMLRLAGRGGARKVVCARGAHRSAVSAMALLGLTPVWLWPEPAAGSALPGTVPPAAVEAALARESGVAAVYLTSPGYYGELSDIAGISAACRRHGVPLLVDAAHGAHLHYLQNGAPHPLAQGADLVCDSAHKTLPVLTGGAWLHAGARAGVTPGEVRDAMALFGSSSPSYLILLSLDLARAWGQAHGQAAFAALQKRVDVLYARLAPLGLARPAGGPFDPVRITLDVGRAGLAGGRAAALLQERGVWAELHDDVHLVLLPSPLLGDAAFERLERALAALPVGGPPVLPARPALPRPQAVLPPGEALRAPRERLPAERLAGRIAAEGAAPCPPGVPIVCPGERVDAELARMLKNYGVNALYVIK